MDNVQDVLLAVTGMTPQVVTETLFGIDQRKEPWPYRVIIITTRRGAQRVRQGLVDEGHLDALCRSLDKPIFAAEDVEIRSIPDAQGQQVDDARTLDDHEALADFIMQSVRELTADDDVRLHASLAGGRKTMTFYLGYAMSLFGRAQDRLSHVLVSEAFENNPYFYFPTRVPTMIPARDGGELDASTAEVCLADIPFIRQRPQLPEVLKRIGDGVHFRQLVALFNLGTRPRDIRLCLHEADARITLHDATQANDEALSAISFSNRFDFSWLWLVADATCRKDASLKRHDDDRNAREAMGWRLMERLSQSLELPLNRQGDYSQQVERWVNEHEQALEAANIRPDHFFLTMKDGADIKTASSRIKERLSLYLPQALVEILSVVQRLDTDGRLHPRTRHHAGFALYLEPTQIGFYP